MILRSGGKDVPLLRQRPVDHGLFRNSGIYGVPSYQTQHALRLTAVAGAVRLLSETIGSQILRTYTGDASQRQPVFQSSQAALFQHPAEGLTSFDVWSDTVTALELYRHAFLWKTKTNRGVEELIPIDPDFLAVEFDAHNLKRVYAWTTQGKRDITPNVIHIRSWASTPGAAVGTSTLELHSQTFATAESLERYRGKYFENDATPGIVLSAKGQLTAEQRIDIMRAWLARHQGPSNVNMPALVWDGMEVKQLGSSMRDAQGAELTDSLIRDVATAFRIYPAELLHMRLSGTPITDIEAITTQFYLFSLMPRIRRLERALASDNDLFPSRSLYPRFDVSEFVRGSIDTQATKVHKLRQAGIYTINEGRAELGLPPIEGGDEIQLTPVGGQANPTLNAVNPTIAAEANNQ